MQDFKVKNAKIFWGGPNGYIIHCLDIAQIAWISILFILAQMGLLNRFLHRIYILKFLSGNIFCPGEKIRPTKIISVFLITSEKN